MAVAVAVQVVALSGDITAPQAAATIGEALQSEFGRVDVLVNNAGVTGVTGFISGWLMRSVAAHFVIYHGEGGDTLGGSLRLLATGQPMVIPSHQG